MKKIIYILVFIIMILPAMSQTIVFSDDFSNSNYTSEGWNITNGDWTEYSTYLQAIGGINNDIENSNISLSGDVINVSFEYVGKTDGLDVFVTTFNASKSIIFRVISEANSGGRFEGSCLSNVIYFPSSSTQYAVYMASAVVNTVADEVDLYWGTSPNPSYVGTYPVSEDCFESDDMTIYMHAPSSGRHDIDAVYIYEKNLSKVYIESPPDYFVTNQSVTIKYNFTNPNNNTMNCSLYVDDIINITNTSIEQNTEYGFYPTLIDGLHTYYINCSDEVESAESSTQNLYIDKTEPSISLSVPSVFGTTVFDDYTMSFIGNATNLNLTTVDRRIFYPNGTQYHRNLTVDFTNPQIISWSDEFSTTPEDNGVWNYYVYAQDSLNNVKTVNLTFTIDNCVPDWYCSNFTECNTTDQQTCNQATDSNNCSYPYSGDYSEFIISECDYCSADVEIHNQTECALQEQTTCYIDNNFGTCCNVTGFESDCPQNESIVCVTSECTSFVYDESDIPKSLSYGLVSILTVLSQVLIVIVIFAISIFLINKTILKK